MIFFVKFSLRFLNLHKYVSIPKKEMSLVA